MSHGRSKRSAQAQTSIDPRFYRALYEDAKDLTDEALIAAAESGQLPSDRLLNPTLFLQKAISAGILPSGFDPLGYRIRTPELWGPNRPEWEPIMHYLRRSDKSDESGWDRPFDPSFYTALYGSKLRKSDLQKLHESFSAKTKTYGSLLEALVRNGWRTDSWIPAFNAHAYAVCNSLADEFDNPTQAVVHFIETGWRDLAPLGTEHEFDPRYYADLCGGQDELPDREMYRMWVELGFVAGAPANEGAHLRAWHVNLPCYPAFFAWHIYLQEHPEIIASSIAENRNGGRWDALRHFLELGCLDGTPTNAIGEPHRASLWCAAGDRFARLGKPDEATKCYNVALLNSPTSAQLLQHAGDNAIRSGDPARALALYAQVREKAAPNFWTWHNGARAALAVGNLELAADWTLGGLAEHPRSPRLWSILHDIQKARHDYAIKRHISAIRSGTKYTGVHLDLDSIFELFLSAYRADKANPRLAKKIPIWPMKIVMLANQDLPQCTHYRIDQKREQLGLVQGLDIQIFDKSDSENFRSAASTADLALFYRLSSNVEVLQSLAYCRFIGIPTIYEIDDLVFDEANFPENFEAYAGAITEDQYLDLRAGAALVCHSITKCDYGLASTALLSSKLSDLVRTRRAMVHRNGLSEFLIAFAEKAPGVLSRGNVDPVTIFYGSGTLAHGADFRDLLEPALSRLLSEHSFLRVSLCGHVDSAALKESFPDQVDHQEYLSDREAYFWMLANSDINVAVLRKNKFNDCKSELKWIEASAFGVPSAVSDVAGFCETLSGGTDVIRVAGDADSWYRALKQLVEDSSLRESLGSAASRRVAHLYNPSRLGKQLRALLVKVIREHSAEEDAKVRSLVKVPAQPRSRRLLVSNVFFPPEAIGGATRVVSDQIDGIRKATKGKYEIGVLSSSNEENPPYQVYSYQWNAIPVWSIAAPFRQHMDWIDFDPLMCEPVQAVVNHFGPDLIHAHAIQRLGTAIFDCALARQIPYIITVHDAWWISDHQFLLDGSNKIVMPGQNEVYETAGNPHSLEASSSRKLRLRRVLAGARNVVVVSDSFADIYKFAGVRRVVSIPNGVPDLPPMEVSCCNPGRVRLAHLGGITAHKGYFLLRRAITLGRFANFDMLVVDHALEADDERLEFWGTTPVRVIGRVPQDRVGALYGSFDVLCAVSLWPESFGLVSREALFYGKWVIASSRGAIGEPIKPLQNGWLVDPKTPLNLLDVLRQIDADPARYREPPKAPFEARSMTSVIADLAKLYDGHFPSG